MIPNQVNLCPAHTLRRQVVRIVLTTVIAIIVSINVMQAMQNCQPEIRNDMKNWIRGEVARAVAVNNVRAVAIFADNKRNFASAHADAYVLEASGTFVVGRHPITALSVTRDVGDCWPMTGTTGHILIHLAATTFISGFTLEHIPAFLHLSENPREAPGNFSVYGYENRNSKHLFGEYLYDIRSRATQFFPVKTPSERSFPVVDLVIRSNHGHPAYTCIYRFKVHGTIDNKSDCP